MGSPFKNPPPYPPPQGSQPGNALGNALGGYNTPAWHSAYNRSLQSNLGAAANNSLPWGEYHLRGKPMWVWLLWAGYTNYSAGDGAVDVIGVVAELDRLIAEQPDKWDAFAVTQRIQGRDLWGTDQKSP